MDSALTGILIAVVVIVVLAIVGIWFWAAYHSLVKLKVRVDETWSDITVELKRRADLIPTIVSSVKGYASHESGVFDTVTRARAETLSASTPAEATTAETHMQRSLKSIFAVADNYPQLQASQSFLQLQAELVDTEDKIQGARRFYNGGIRELNSKARVFPNTLFAKRLGVTEGDFFEVAEPSAIAEPPRVQF